MVGGNAFGALDESVHGVTDGNVELGAAADGEAGAFKPFFEGVGQRLAQAGWETTTIEFVLDRYCCLFPPDREFLSELG